MEFDGRRNGVAFASAVAVVIIAVTAVGAYYIIAFPRPSPSTSGPTTTQYPPGLGTTTTQWGGVPTSRAAEGWESGLVVKAALTSPQVQSYIKTAYSYKVNYISQTSASANMVSVLLNVTGNQVVAGNWTTGYRISYTKLDGLNVTVQFTYPSNYTVVRAWPAQLPDRNFSLTYDATQQKVIGVILSNATVRQALGPAFYVQSVSTFPIANGTYGGDYFALLYQLNGTRIVSAFVDPSITAVVKSYTNTRGETFCYGSNANLTLCFTSPWSVGNGMA